MTNTARQEARATRTYYMRTQQEAAPLRVAIYSRISEDPEGTEAGVKRQEADCLQRAEREGWEIVSSDLPAAPFWRENDAGASRHSKKPRPVYAALLAAAERGDIDAILAYSNSRLTRRPREFEDLIDLAETRGTRLFTIVSGDDDLSTADGQMVARFKAAADAGEAKRTSERLMRSQAERRITGGQSTKRAFGWTIAHALDASGRPVLNKWGKPIRLPDPLDPVEGPALAEALRRIREEGASIAAVARYWNGLGLTTTQGKAWSTTRTKEALVRWRNAGVVTHNGEPVSEAGSWAPVCTREELEEVRALLNADGKRRRPAGRPAVALLAGIATCGKCGRVMYGGKQEQGPKEPGEKWFVVYRCSGSQDQTGNKCWTTIGRKRLDTVAVNALLHRQWTAIPDETTATPAAGRLSALKAAQDDAQAAIDRLVDAVANGDLKGSQVAVRRAELEAEHEAAQKEIDALLTRNAELRLTADLSRSLWTGQKISIADAAKIQARLRETFDAMDRDQQRTLLRSLPPIRVLPGSEKMRIAVGDERFF